MCDAAIIEAVIWTKEDFRKNTYILYVLTTYKMLRITILRTYQISLAIKVVKLSPVVLIHVKYISFSYASYTSASNRMLDMHLQPFIFCEYSALACVPYICLWSLCCYLFVGFKHYSNLWEVSILWVLSTESVSWRAWPTMYMIPLTCVINSQHMLCMYCTLGLNPSTITTYLRA